MLKYYKLTTSAPDPGLFRSSEFDEAAEAAAKEAEELAADREEEAFYARLAHSKRVAEGLRLLSACSAERPAVAAGVLSSMAGNSYSESARELAALLAEAASLQQLPAGSAEQAAASSALLAKVAQLQLDSASLLAQGATPEAAAAAAVKQLQAHAAKAAQGSAEWGSVFKALS